MFLSLLFTLLSLTYLSTFLSTVSSQAPAIPADLAGVQTYKFSSTSSSIPWAGRYLHQTITDGNGNILLVGGCNYNATSLSPSPNNVFAEMWRSTDMGVTWNLIPSDPAVSRRMGHALVIVNSNILMIFGGHDGTTTLNTLYTSQDNGNTWQLGSQPFLNARYGQATQFDPTASALVVVGGATLDYTQKSSPLSFNNDVYYTTNAGTEWVKSFDLTSCPACAFPTNRIYAQFTSLQAVFYLVGGITLTPAGTLTTNQPFMAMADLWSSADQGATWTQISATNPTPFSSRALPLLLNYADAIYLIGGGVDVQVNNPTSLSPLQTGVLYVNSSMYYDDVWESTDGCNTWNQAQPRSLFNPRLGSSGTLVGSTLVLTGGTNTTFANNTYVSSVYNTTTNSLIGMSYSYAVTWNTQNLADAWVTNLPTVSTSSAGAIVAGVVGSVVGLGILLIAMRKCGQRYGGGKEVIVSGQKFSARQKFSTQHQVLTEETEETEEAGEIEETEEV